MVQPDQLYKSLTVTRASKQLRSWYTQLYSRAEHRTDCATSSNLTEPTSCICSQWDQFSPCK